MSEVVIQFENCSGTLYSVRLMIEKLPFIIFETYCRRITRKSYDSEREYFHISDRAFNKLKIKCVGFTRTQIGWYGGDVTLICEESIKRFINDIINY